MAAAKPQPAATFTLAAKPLARVLAGLLPVIDKGNGIPILKTVLIQAAKDTVTFNATNLDLQVQTQMTAGGDGAWSGAVDLKLLHSWVSSAAERITFSVNGSHLRMDDGSGTRANVLFTDPEHYPNPLQPDAWATSVTIEAAILHGLLSRVLPAITDDESRFALQGVRLRSLDGKLEAVGTDGVRLVVATVETNAACTEIVLPRKGLAALVRLLADTDGAVTFQQSDNLLRFTLGDTALTARKLNGNYPDVARLLELPPDTLTINVAAIISALERLIPLTDERRNWTKWTVGGGRIKLEALKTDVGDASAEIACDYSGEDSQWGAASAMMLPVLKACGAETLTLHFDASESGRPITFTAPGLIYVHYTIQPHLL